LILAGAVSALGDWIYLTALPILVYEQAVDLALMGIVAGVRLLPFLLFSIPAGVVADRFSPARILLITESSRAAAMATAALLVVLDGPVAGLLLCASVAAIGGTFAMPAQAALVPRVARDEPELAAANAVDATMEGLASLAGPASLRSCP
jgi:MFS family permease